MPHNGNIQFYNGCFSKMRHLAWWCMQPTKWNTARDVPESISVFEQIGWVNDQ